MLNFIAWYLTITLLGWLSFPLIYRLFPKFADRGYSFARTAGLLVWAYAFWMLASLGIAQNDVGGILLGLAVLAGLSLWAISSSKNGSKSTGERIGEIIQWLKENLKLILNVEILFLLAFIFLALVRAANPEALGTEKPMELAFINAILRSPTFPPRDPWLAGYAISYYHFGYIITAMLAKITTTAGSIAFNLMLALVFALGAVGSYGILYNLLTPTTEHRKLNTEYRSLLAPLFLLLVSNFEGFLELIHQYGILWTSKPNNFWIWLDMKELSRDPATVGQIPERFWWWWRASRVIQDYDLVGNFREVIDEFPFFSYLLGDLHPHILATPFALLVIAVALYIFSGGWRGRTEIFGFRFHLKPLGIFSVALLLGGIAFLNTWDILIAAALIASAYTLARVHADGWRWDRLEDFLFFGLVSGISAILLYLPFYIGFSSQAGGILPNLINPTRGAHLWVMFGTLLIPIFLWLLDLWRGKKHRPNWALGFALALGLPLFLWLFSWFLAAVISLLDPGLVNGFLQSQELGSRTELFTAATARRGEYIGGALTLFVLLASISAFLFSRQKDEDESTDKSVAFVLLIALLASLLVVAPEYIYLRDQFGTRLNTIFKFYYQAWILWSIAAAYGAAILFAKAHRWLNIILIGFAIIAGLVYPLYGVISKTNGFKPQAWTLDGAAHITRNAPDEAAAIAWLQNTPDGVILEAVGGSYTGYARISTNSGLPTVLGWPGHESQWRGGYNEIGSRQADVEMIYTATDWETTKKLLAQYNVDYVYVGALERSTYSVNEGKFQRYLELVFSESLVNIYAVP
ncbi:MAG: hypothetical protein HN855_09390 [Anaerolineae bacterium]|jgi:YYY domain-containing protein|nr:hypothetical protein [Anaerolineae bacterium]MBT7072903.1 hypothetical protein [Anaerolineae bacterium]MBT7325360.1 hypothetical protein [Anaerolineae bacterium]